MCDASACLTHFSSLVPGQQISGCFKWNPEVLSIFSSKFVVFFCERPDFVNMGCYRLMTTGKSGDFYTIFHDFPSEAYGKTLFSVQSLQEASPIR